jgi:hypothetical protein
MSQEFRLSIKNFSQRKIVNVKDIFKNLTETEKAILEREKQLSEEKFKRTKQQQQQHNHQTVNNPKKKINLTKNSEFSKSSVNLPAKSYEQQPHHNNHHYHFNQQQRQLKPNRYKIDYDETLNNRPWLLNEANFEENYEENFKRYISQIDLNLNKIINEKKLKKKNDFDFNQNHQQHQKYYQHQTPVFRRESLVFIHNDQNEDQKLNKFNGFKKKIKNLFNNNEPTKFTEHNNRPIHLIRLQSQQQDPNQYINNNNNNNNNDNFISDPFYIEATTNKKWNNHNKNFKYKSPLIKEYMYMNNHHTNNNNNNEIFTGQNDNNNNKFRKLSNLLNRTKNLLH